jgi:hypothetical protein
MRKILVLLIYVFSAIGLAQVKPSVTFDPQTGNYIIEYEGFEGEDQRPTVMHLIFEPSTKINPEVKGFVHRQEQLNKFSYRYEVKNTSLSKQRILYFELEQNVEIDSIFAPNQQWTAKLWSGYRKFHWGHTMVSPEGMETPYNGIAIDSTATGFGLVSSGLPSIVIAYFKGLAAMLAFPDEPPGEIEILLEPLERFPNNSVIRKTVGPKDPPNPFVPLNYLDTLLSYTRQSVQLGWLIDKNAAKRIDQKIELVKRLLQMAENCAANPKKTDLLDQARKAIKEDESVLKKEYGNEVIQGLQKPIIEENKELKQFEKELAKKKPNEAKCKELCGKTYTWLAIKTLESLVYEVEVLNKLGEKGKKQYLTSEAYALLKYNTEYLIGQLMNI